MMGELPILAENTVEKGPQVATHLGLAAVLSLGLHVALIALIGAVPASPGKDAGSATEIVEVEFIIPDRAGADPSSTAGEPGAASPPSAQVHRTEEPSRTNDDTAQPSDTTPPIASGHAPADRQTTAVIDPIQVAPPEPGIDVLKSVAAEPVAPAETSSAETVLPAVERPKTAKPTPSSPPPPTVKPRPSAEAPKLERRSPGNTDAPPAARGPKHKESKLGKAPATKIGQSAPAAAGKQDALALYLASIRNRIAGQQPRRPGMERGRVEIRFNVAADGKLHDFRVERSDDDTLEDEALKIVRRSSPVPPIPNSAGKTTLSMSVTIEFR